LTKDPACSYSEGGETSHGASVGLVHCEGFR
jgi:hypothetical protein